MPRAATPVAAPAPNAASGPITPPSELRFFIALDAALPAIEIAKLSLLMTGLKSPKAPKVWLATSPRREKLSEICLEVRCASDAAFDMADTNPPVLAFRSTKRDPRLGIVVSSRLQRRFVQLLELVRQWRTHSQLEFVSPAPETGEHCQTEREVKMLADLRRHVSTGAIDFAVPRSKQTSNTQYQFNAPARATAPSSDARSSASSIVG